MVLICERCGYSTLKIYSMKRHLTKRTPCTPTLSDIEMSEIYAKLFPPKATTLFICEYCNKSFANRHNKLRHMKQCPNQLKAMQDKIATLEKQLKEAKAERRVSTINNGTITNSFNTTTNIQINPFGKENIDYLLNSPEFEKYVVNILKKKEHGFLQYIKDKYFHEDHPENHTIKKPIKNDAIVKCYNGNEWENNIINNITHTIMQGFESDFNEFLKKIHNKAEIPSKYLKCYISFNTAVTLPLNFNLIWNTNDDCEMDDDELQENNKIKKNILKLLFAFIYENTKLIHSDKRNSTTLLKY